MVWRAIRRSLACYEYRWRISARCEPLRRKVCDEITQEKGERQSESTAKGFSRLTSPATCACGKRPLGLARARLSLERDLID